MKNKVNIYLIATAMAAIALMAACAGASDETDSAGATPAPNEGEMVSVKAPIVETEVLIAESFPVQYFLQVTSGLRNSCVEFEGYETSREGETITVDLTNLEPADRDIPCDEEYRTVTTSIALGSAVNYDSGTTYTININDATTTFTTEGEAPDNGAKVSVKAPIENIEVFVMESFPVQYSLQVISGLPNGCAEFEGYSVNREGETIKIDVTNLEPADPNIACTEEYRTVTTNIGLGSTVDYDAGTTYTINVNDVTTSFTTEGQASGVGPVGVSYEVPFSIKVGETAILGEVGPMVDLVEILEDSRCPSDVTCIWAGRAMVLLRVMSVGDALGFGIQDLTLEVGQKQAEGNTVSGASEVYTFEVTNLDPYPSTTAEGPPDYSATIVVTTSPR